MSRRSAIIPNIAVKNAVPIRHRLHRTYPGGTCTRKFGRQLRYRL